MQPNYQPRGKKVLVKDIQKELQTTESGIILDPSLQKSHYKEVFVVAVSPDIDCGLEEGDKCKCEHSGVEIEAGYWLVNEDALVCKIS